MGHVWIGVAHRPPRTGLKTVLLVAVENLVAGLTRYAELPAHVRHGLTVLPMCPVRSVTYVPGRTHNRELVCAEFEEKREPVSDAPE